ncbi:MAG: hypothetical protein U0103_02655 [Candidatus Obscuribacterales bacterium]
MTAGKNRNPRNAQGHGSLDDLLWLHKASAPTTVEHVESLEQETLDSEAFARIFIQTYPRLDPKNQGLTKEHLSKLIMRPDAFSHDEYVMLVMLAKYFDTIANLVDDEPGPQTMITPMDKEVLCQFLVHGKLSLAELHRWRLLCQAPKEEPFEGPPLSGA